MQNRTAITLPASQAAARIGQGAKVHRADADLKGGTYCGSRTRTLTRVSAERLATADLCGKCFPAAHEPAITNTGEAIVESVVALAVELVESGRLDPADMDWSMLRDEHAARIDALAASPEVAEAITTAVWKLANDEAGQRHEFRGVDAEGYAVYEVPFDL